MGISRNCTIIIFATIISLFLIFTILGAIIFLVISYYPNSNNESKKSYLHKYTQISPNRNQTNGFVKISKQLSDGEYLSYKAEETGELFMISNFGGSEYECTGSCYCNKEITEDDSRRTTINMFSLADGIVLLITAFTATVAINMAKEIYQNNCAQKFSDICEAPYVESQTYDCVEIEREEEKTETPADYEEIEFECWGYCIHNEIYNQERLSFKMKSLTENKWHEICQSMEVDKRISIKSSPTDPRIVEYAKYEFGRLHLEPYCLSANFQVYSALKGGEKQDRTKLLIKDVLTGGGQWSIGKNPDPSYFHEVLSCVAYQVDKNKVERKFKRNVECIRVGSW